MKAETARIAVDAVAVSTTVATLMQMLPPIAAVFSIIWVCVQIYEWVHNSETKLAKFLSRRK